MDVDIDLKKRIVLPRFRDFTTTMILGELKSPEPKHAGDRKSDELLLENISDWQTNKTLSFATDLLGSALVLGANENIKDAADFVLSEQSNSTGLQRRIALQALDSEFCSNVSLPNDLSTSSSQDVINRSSEHVRRLRRQLKAEFRNPIKLVELSREYAILGKHEKAKRTMSVAVALGSANRYVLRSAARLFVHLGDTERAHYYLKNAPSLQSDPWLLAAEIAVSEMMDRTSGQIHTGLSHIASQNFNNFEWPCCINRDEHSPLPN